MIPSLYPLMPHPLTSSMSTLLLCISSMRNPTKVAMTLELIPPFSLTQNCRRRPGQNLPRLNLLPVRNDSPTAHTATIVVVMDTLLIIALHQSKRVTRPILPPRTMMPLLYTQILLTDTHIHTFL